MSHSIVEARPPLAGVRYAVFSGLCATLVGIGLARFAYTPLIPALIADGWFSPGQAVTIGAANLAGYLAGALLGRRMAARSGAAFVLRTNMALAAAAFFACAVPLSFAWFFLWRFASGFAGGVLMVVAASAILPHVPAERRGLAGGLIILGVGLGATASGTLVPLLLRAGLVQAWCGLGALALLLAAASWGGWPRGDGLAPKRAERAAAFQPALLTLYAVYGLNAVGIVPHMVFLVDYVARGLGSGLAAGGHFWVLYGIGAACGPVATGWVADRMGFARTLRAGLAVQALAVLAVTQHPAGLAISSFVVGAFTPGIVTLVIGRIHELLPFDVEARQAAWSHATIGFALMQALGAFGFSALYAHTGSYALLFGLGSAALATALALDGAMAFRRRRPASGR